MKTMFALLVLMISTSVFARQYIQCSSNDMNTTDVMVVNLQTPKAGTLFLSSGLQNPDDERILVKIAFDRVEKDAYIYKVVDEVGTGYVAVPSNSLGKNSNYLTVLLQFASAKIQFSCFSRMYND